MGARRRRDFFWRHLPVAGKTDAMWLVERAEQLAGYGLCFAAAVAVLTGVFILLFRSPAKAKVIFNGSKADRRTSRAALISNGVHTVEQRLYPWLAEDLMQFRTGAGQEIRLSMRRRFRSEPPTLIWYAAADPRRATAISPVKCLAFACLCAATALCLRW